LKNKLYNYLLGTENEKEKGFIGGSDMKKWTLLLLISDRRIDFCCGGSTAAGCRHPCEREG
jgi:hypothetical protein